MQPITLGEAEIRRVEELSVRRRLRELTTDAAILAANRHWLYPLHVDADDTWEMVVQSWLVLHQGRIILVDPCVGNGRSFPDFPLFDGLDTPYIERFAATGIRPDQVDYVFCTHLHMDHCGWNTQLRDGRYVPTFPNARYVMLRGEFERWDPARPGHVAAPANASTFETSVLPVLEAGLADIVEPSHMILPGLTVEPAHGHTLGHCALRLCSAQEEAWFTGDTFHHPIELIHPEMDVGTCEDFAMNVATRRRLIAHFVASGALIVPAHFGAPHVGRLCRDGEVARYVPHGGQ